ncbi:MAG: hypothetical protein ACKVIN_16240 [Longimicrobiales bacterium]
MTQPDPDVADPDAPGMVILNSGILHRPGASRLYVQIARKLAEDGVTTLRFDFSGIGDSEVRRDAIPIEERFTQETREAMDYLGTVTNGDRFLVGGLCSGADGAFWTALVDERVIGVWQIDAFCYKTFGYYKRRYGPKLLKLGAWVDSVRVRLPQTGADQPDKDEELFVKPEYRRVFPPRSDVGAGLRTLLDRGVGLYFFFTGGLEEYNYEMQHADTFPGLDLTRRAQIRHIGECSHMVTDLEHQKAVVSDVCGWARTFNDRATDRAVATTYATSH